MFPEAGNPQSDSTNKALEPVLDVLNTTFSEEALREVGPVMTNIAGVSRNGNRFEVDRRTTEITPINESLLNGAIEVKDIRTGKLEFDFDPNTRIASNIDGLSINITMFGRPQNLEVEQLSLGKDDTGKPVLKGAFDNPLPDEVLRITGLPSSFNVEFPLNEGGLAQPRLSKMFADAAASTGPSIGGLLASDMLSEASNVSLFVESNPQWVEDVVKPALGDIVRELDLASLANHSFTGLEVLDGRDLPHTLQELVVDPVRLGLRPGIPGRARRHREDE